MVAILVITLLVIIFVLVAFYTRSSRTSFEDTNYIGNTNAVGVDPHSDEYGCDIFPGGYDKEISACVKTWFELDDGQKRAAKIAVDYIDSTDQLTILDAYLSCKGVGCYVIEIDSPKGKNQITLHDWDVIEYFECIDSIDCQPIVPPENSKYCAQIYIRWAEENCPGFGVVY